MTKLPSKFEDKSQLRHMKVGDSGYTVPWAMWVDLEGNCWLNENYTIQSTTGGTVQLKITRVVDGYIAHIYEMQDDYKWIKQKSPCYMSPNEVLWGDVVGHNLRLLEKPAMMIQKSTSFFTSLFKQLSN